MSAMPEALLVAMVDGVVRSLERAGEDLLGEAQRRAPLEYGDLRGSAILTLIVNDERLEGEGAGAQARAKALAILKAGGKLELNAEVAFGMIYAARQHEETTWAHPKGGQAKYLSSVLEERGAQYVRALELEVELAGRLA